ncbi:pesticin C-terminus-like muramidase [Iodidimonas muriae]|uniref:pesticin C-terminus-like muramidase n=1 Tax=Iodidimonas muriae TaxID=261467 RepID=UPI0035713D03
MARNFNRHSRYLRFQDLPPAAQTVIASVATQYGPNLHLSSKEGGTPRFWGFVTRGEWQKALEELRFFGWGPSVPPRQRGQQAVGGVSISQRPRQTLKTSRSHERCRHGRQHDQGLGIFCS